ncbi:MAG: tyrosine-type recombinase/integrase [Deltaproteobacteria bacterium]|nr:tyrosine-type recombinase/integrase [Deltaproteobacteria bacterium]
MKEDVCGELKRCDRITSKGVGFMKGSFHFDKKANRYYVSVYWEGKRYRIFNYNGDPIYHEKTAEKLLNKIRAEIDDSVFQPRSYFPESPLSTSGYALQWLKVIGVSKKTLRDYGTAVRRYINVYFGEKDIRHIRSNDLKLFHAWIQGSPKWKYNVMGVLRTMLRSALENEDLTKVPPFPQLTYDQPEEIQFLTLDQQEKVLGAIPQRHQAIFRMAMEYGLRVGEVRALQKDCVTGNEIIIKRTFSDNDLMERTKTKRIRKYTITSYARGILDSLPPPFSFIFVRDDGKPYTNKDLNKIWHQACKEVKVDIKLYNAIRHSLGCQLLNEGKDLSFVQEVLGHTRSDMTKRYAQRSNPVIGAVLDERRVIHLDSKQTVKGK